jgi:CRP/FNR family transcriptional regulator
MNSHPPTDNNHLVKPHEKFCDQCDAFHQCICANIDPQVVDKIKPMFVKRGPFLAGDFLLRQNENFSSFYLIQSGVLRSEIVSYNGRRKIKWFYFPGDLIGMEAVAG